MTASNITLWLLRAADDFSLPENLHYALNEPQKVHLAGVSPYRRKTFCLSRLLLGFALENAYGYKSAEWTITERAALPPVAKRNGLSPNFSISHSGNIFGIALGLSGDSATAKLGLDIEIYKPDRKIAIARYLCNPQQRAKLKSLPGAEQQRRYLIRLWTQKEAYFKAHEQAILNPQLKNLSVSPADPGYGRMSTSSLDEVTEISIYHARAASIATRCVLIDANGHLTEHRAPGLEWLNYCVHLSGTAKSVSPT